MSNCCKVRNEASDTGCAQFTLIANVPFDTVRQDLVSEFRRFGRVELAMVVCDEASRHPHKEWTSTAGYAFVRFNKRSEAASAIEAASIGLITIKGVRVRADWARKDSYAKRGRVSSVQGAPLLTPSGIPDGIQALQMRLMSSSNDGYDEDTFTSNSQRIDCHHTPEHKSKAETCRLFSEWSQGKWSTTPRSGKTIATSPGDDPMLLDWSSSEGDITTGLRLPVSTGTWPRVGYNALEHLSVDRTKPYDSILSPCSRELLAQALNDVALDFDFSPSSTISSPMTCPVHLNHQTDTTPSDASNAPF